ncbi:MAG: hypothetical protein GYA29_09865 [Methanothrix sp.]|nr:hypothetical protein [Methanothrix sp.]OPY44014.1 MAG: hypothetical protein A4E46_01560 [Methanosaeta sp. PtaU1.Bin016]
MRFGLIGLCLLVMCFTIGAAAGQGSNMQQTLSVGSGFIDDNFINSLLNLGEEAGLPWSGPDFENSSQTYSFFSEFYINTSMPLVGGFTPVKVDVTHKTPSKVYFGSGREVTFTQYQSAVASTRSNELWIQKGADWSQYAIVPAGTGLQLIAFAPLGGQADYYEVTQTDSAGITSKRVNFYSGYNSINYAADKVGRHILVFVINNQPSNAVIVDVISQAPSLPQAPIQASPAAQTTTYSGSAQYQTYSTTYLPQTSAATGDTPVTIQTTMKGYDVFVDGVLVGKDGATGDQLDGVFKFTVLGGQMHTIRIFDGMNNYEKPMYFERGVAKVINVPPATTLTVGGL